MADSTDDLAVPTAAEIAAGDEFLTLFNGAVEPQLLVTYTPGERPWSVAEGDRIRVYMADDSSVWRTVERITPQDDGSIKVEFADEG